MIKIIITSIFFFVRACAFVHAQIFYAYGCKDLEKVSLTFDDGPCESTKKILKILKNHNVKATFFILGIRVKNNSNITKAIYSDGHEIANHTYRHINFYNYKNIDKTTRIEEELLQGEVIIKNTTGTPPFLVRFPYGYAKADAINIAKKHGYYIINWSFGCDWKQMTAEEMHEKYKKALKKGAIFLMHDLPKNEKILSFLSSFICYIKGSGYEIVTVSELLNLKQQH
ncbi:MAG: polysaccharide deacetylase family protein [Endomicrobium sp.]|jgi:peptidoglycan/xylan/chitin deacetylase (PgdA/CDA1 family)|nr:polysaccharide deacetylase family protein [Endomicrobium sp.]